MQHFYIFSRTTTLILTTVAKKVWFGKKKKNQGGFNKGSFHYEIIMIENIQKKYTLNIFRNILLNKLL